MLPNQMSSYNHYPPHILHSSHPVAPSVALTLLSAYLEATTTDASLHPNALLTERGPISATSGANTGLVLHNLKRVEAGLKGEHLGADLSFAQFGGEGLPSLQVELNGNQSELPTRQRFDQDGQPADVDMEEGGWQDKGEFERQQEFTDGEIGKRSQAVIEGSKELLNVPSVEKTPTTGDKAERKRRKREKRKEQKQKDEHKKREKHSKE